MRRKRKDNMQLECSIFKDSIGIAKPKWMLCYSFFYLKMWEKVEWIVGNRDADKQSNNQILRHSVCKG